MSEYVPTTEGAQSYYVAGRTQMRRQITGEQAIDITGYSHEFDRWLAKRDAEVAAKAWDRGCASGYREAHTNVTEKNPYRQEREEQ